MKYILTAIISFLAYSSQTDIELQTYIKKFQYKPMTRPSGLNQNLFNLGKELFSEKIVSGNKDISCKTCHDPKFGTGDLLPLPIGTGGNGDGPNRVVTGKKQIIPRNSPNLFNLGHEDIEFMFWDGRVSYKKRFLEFNTPEPGLNGEWPEYFEITDVLDSPLSAQALFPPTSHSEMRGQVGENDIANASSNKEVWAIIMKRLLSKKKYQNLFKRAFPRTLEFNIGHFGKALAHFQKHEFAVYNTPWDQYLRGDKSALSEDEKRGAIIFSNQGKCSVCHGGELLGGDTFHNVTVPQIGPGKDIRKNDEGLFYTTRKHNDRYKFKTPMLRNFKYTAPYFHSGTAMTIDEVIDHYTNGANGLDDYTGENLRRFESNNYKRRLFVETDSYMLFRKKETAHPSMKGHQIKLTNREKRLLKTFLLNSLNE